MSFGWIFPKWAGKYRIIQVTISGKETSPYYKLPELVLNFCEDLNERLKHLPSTENESFIVEVVKILAWFQHRFVYIHPFQDYNGRLARMFTIFLLLKLGIPPVEINVEKISDRKHYITAMQEADSENLSLLEDIIGQTIFEGLKRISE